LTNSFREKGSAVPPRFIEAGNEISLALLDIEFDVFEQYKTKEDRIDARRAVH
jgi:hypothetical protein